MKSANISNFCFNIKKQPLPQTYVVCLWDL